MLHVVTKIFILQSSSNLLFILYNILLMGPEFSHPKFYFHILSIFSDIVPVTTKLEVKLRKMKNIEA